MDSQVNRPSSWPVRRERHRAAQVLASQNIVSIDGKLDQVIQSLCSIATALKASTPPGLDGASLQVAQLLDTLMKRIERLESLLVCSPPVDLQPTVNDVLNSMLHGKPKPTQPEPEASPAKAVQFHGELETM